MPSYVVCWFVLILTFSLGQESTEDKSPCTLDHDKFCKETRKQSAAAKSCLLAVHEKLSEPCLHFFLMNGAHPRNMTEVLVSLEGVEQILATLKEDVLSIVTSLPTAEKQNQTCLAKGAVSSNEGQWTDLQTELDKLPWDKWEGMIETDSRMNVHRLPNGPLMEYLNVLTPFAEIAPEKEATVLQRPGADSLQLPDCKAPPDALRGILTGSARNPVPRLFDIFTVAYELDVLETRLFELQDSVDLWGIMESTHTHRATPKPLFFARNSLRFKRHLDKIVYLVGDYSDWGKRGAAKQQQHGDDWHIEVAQRGILLTEFVKGVPEDIRPYDLILHGDVDEIPDGRLLRFLKFCETTTTPLSFHAQYYYFNFHWTAESQNTRNPVLFRYDQAVNKDGLLFPLRTNQGKILPLGSAVHMTYFGGPIINLYKILSLAEGGQVPRNDIRFLKQVQPGIEAMRAGKRLCCPNDQYSHPSHYYFLPWYVKANPERWTSMQVDVSVPIDRP